MSQGIYLPEGMMKRLQRVDHKRLSAAIKSGEILEGTAISCSAGKDLTVDMGGIEGIVPYSETADGISEGRTRDIAVISRVGRPVCFKIIGKEGGRYILSRRLAQREALMHFEKEVQPGDVIRCIVTHIEPFGAFVDVGCGNISMIGIENISVSRIKNPSERFEVGQPIFCAVISGKDHEGRITLTHRELLGTWEENSAGISGGQTRVGIVRSIENYGAFIELTPNLSGLAESREGLVCGEAVSVYVKSVIPEKMKIKLTVVERLGRKGDGHIKESDYRIKSGRMKTWNYSPACCRGKNISTVF